MKTKLLIFCISLFFGMSKIQAQNIQLHYDFGDGREFFTTTIEMFKPDSFGSTFFFVDMDFAGINNGMSLAYFEIARDFRAWEAPVALHVEYNDGFQFSDRDTFGIIYPQSWFVGLSFPLQFRKISFTTMFLYKATKAQTFDDNFQWTNVWFVPINNYMFSFSGFTDLWSATDYDLDPVNQHWKFLAEPQFWWHFYGGFGLGTELEISYNFPLYNQELQFRPTLALRYDF